MMRTVDFQINVRMDAKDSCHIRIVATAPESKCTPLTKEITQALLALGAQEQREESA